MTIRQHPHEPVRHLPRELCLPVGIALACCISRRQFQVCHPIPSGAKKTTFFFFVQHLGIFASKLKRDGRVRKKGTFRPVTAECHDGRRIEGSKGLLQ